MQGKAQVFAPKFFTVTEILFSLVALGPSQVDSVKSVEVFADEKGLEFISIQKEASGSRNLWHGVLLVPCVTEHISFTGLIFQVSESLNVFIFRSSRVRTPWYPVSKVLYLLLVHWVPSCCFG